MWFEPNQLGCLGGSVGRATALKAGGRGFESHPSSLFPMKIEKRALRFVPLPLTIVVLKVHVFIERNMLRLKNIISRSVVLTKINHFTLCVLDIIV